jgi:metal-responsive CopG/Arc/MetJ family transcriptional regulator
MPSEMKQVNTAMPDDLYQALMEAVESEGISRGAFIRRAVAKALETENPRVKWGKVKSSPEGQGD